MSERGKFIAIDGLDGSGKSCQVIMLTEFLRSKGTNVMATQEHWRNGVWGQTIHMVVELKARKSDRMATQLGFLADRVDHTAQLIKPQIEGGRLVITDRYSEASINYSVGSARKAVIEMTDILIRNGDILVPDLYILLDVPVDEAMKRLDFRRSGRVNINSLPKELIGESTEAEKIGRESIFEKKEFLQVVRKNYLESFSGVSRSRVVINGCGEMNDVFNRITQEVQRRIK